MHRQAFGCRYMLLLMCFSSPGSQMMTNADKADLQKNLNRFKPVHRTGLVKPYTHPSLLETHNHTSCKYMWSSTIRLQFDLKKITFNGRFKGALSPHLNLLCCKMFKLLQGWCLFQTLCDWKHQSLAFPHFYHIRALEQEKNPIKKISKRLNLDDVKDAKVCRMNCSEIENDKRLWTEI